MPFTISHAAAALPLSPITRRLRLPLAAIVVGTMSPDFEYFIHLRTLALWGHSPHGLFVFCLPAGILVLSHWEFLAREPVLDLLGLAHGRHIQSREVSWWLGAAVAIVIGAATHVLWDSFTHEGRWGVQRLPILNTYAKRIDGRPLPWFIVVDQVSTVIGGAIVAGWLAREMWRAGSFRTIARSRWRWSVLIALAISAIALGVWNGARQSPAMDYWSGEFRLAQATVGWQLGLGLAIVVFSVAYRLQSPDRFRSSSIE
jgi:hypothetical protein